MSTEQDQVDVLGMSDEDFLKADPSTMAQAAAVEEVQEAAEVVEPATPAAQEDTGTEVEAVADEVADDKGEGQQEGAEGEVAGDSQATKPEEADEAATDGKKEDEGKEVKPEPEAKKDDKEKPNEVVVDYKAEYERLLAPFKANGRDVQVESVDEAVALMQMGANYTKKMAALKPNLKLMKMLENNGFLSEDKIGFLIDLGKKDPAAITKLVKESGIDPLEIDTGKAEAYKPKTYAVGDNEMELDTVLDELQGSESYTRTLDVVSNKWDAASKQMIAAHPQLLKVIDSHVACGIYDLISNAVEKDRMLGRLTGLSDIDAYKQVGDALQAKGAFNHLAPAKPEATKSNTPPAVVTPKPKAQEDDKLKEKRRAASSTKPAAPVVVQEFNPLEMSDEEFARMPAPKIR